MERGPCRSRALSSKTRTRFTAVHRCPEYENAPETICEAVSSRSASGSTSAASFPPSSKRSGIIEAFEAIRRATREELDERYDFAGVLGRDPAFVRVLDLAGRVAGTDASVLITGDSGTGKEIVAGAIHRNSPRRDLPLVKVNLGGIASTLFESEMFGHVRGAFTDAKRDHAGRFAAAEGGTVFLDEIGELDPRNQVKLLRVLQDRTFEPVGSSVTRRLDARVISATNRDLRQGAADGSFREDLPYRINLIALPLPPLAQRRQDVAILARHFLSRAAAAYGVSHVVSRIRPPDPVCAGWSEVYRDTAFAIYRIR